MTRLGTIGGFTLTVGNNGLIYAASNDNYLCVVNPNGQEVSRFQRNNWLSYPVIAADNTIIVADSRDNSLLNGQTKNTIFALSPHCNKDQTYDLHWVGDLSEDGIVNFMDIAFLAADWFPCRDPYVYCYYPGNEFYLYTDTNRDQYLDFADLAAILNQWLYGE
jgi:hypothetical protein